MAASRVYRVEVLHEGEWVTSRFFRTLKAAQRWAKRYAGRIEEA